MNITAPYLHTLWCDDIRMEIGNKPSFMGAFTGGMLIPSLPTTLHKLGVHSSIAIPPDQQIKTLSLEVVRDDGEVVAAMSPGPEVPLTGPEKVREDSTRRGMTVTLVIAPLPIPEGCRWLMVRAMVNGQPLEGNKLRIEVDSDQFTLLMGAPATQPGDEPAE